MNTPLSSKRIATIVLTVYVIVSVGYIGYRMWQDFVNRYSTQVYAQAKADTIQAIVSQASDGSCKPVTIYNNTQQVQVIDTACLSAAPADTSETNQK